MLLNIISLFKLSLCSIDLINEIKDKIDYKIKNKEYLYISDSIKTHVHEVCININDISLSTYNDQRIMINVKSLHTCDYIDKNKFISKKLFNHILNFFKYKNNKITTYLLVSRTENNHILYDYIIKKFEEWTEFTKYYEKLVKGNFLILHHQEKKIDTKYFVKLIDKNCSCYYVKCMKTNLYFELYLSDMCFKNLFEIEIKRKYEKQFEDLDRLNFNINSDFELSNHNTNDCANVSNYRTNNLNTKVNISTNIFQEKFLNRYKTNLETNTKDKKDISVARKFNIYDIDMTEVRQRVSEFYLRQNEHKNNKSFLNIEEKIKKENLGKVLNLKIDDKNTKYKSLSFNSDLKTANNYETKKITMFLTNPWFEILENFICIETDIWSTYLFYNSHNSFCLDFFETKRFLLVNKIRTYHIKDEHFFIKDLIIQILPCEIRINNLTYSNINGSNVIFVKNNIFLFLNKYFDIVDQILLPEYSVLFLIFNSTINTILFETVIIEIIKSPNSGEYLILSILIDTFSIFNKDFLRCKKDFKMFKQIINDIRNNIQNFLYTNTYKLFVILYFIKFEQLITSKSIINDYFWILKDNNFITYIMSYEFMNDFTVLDVLCKRKKQVNNIFTSNIFFLFKCVLDFENHFYFIENGIDMRICDSYRCLMHELYFDEEKQKIRGVESEKIKNLLKFIFYCFILF